jgi:site-specific DNA recombinase
VGSSPDLKRRAVGYVRISRDRDNETSTTTQRKAIEAYCVTRNWILVDVIIEPGRSAFKASRASRPGWRKAMDVVNSGAADAFVVWKVDRAARNTLDLLRFVEELEQQGAQFASVTEQMDTTTPQGQVMLTLVGALAQLESAQKSDRATAWHRHRRLTGAVPAGPAALGYTKPEPNTLVPDPAVAPHVAAAAEKVADGGSVSSACRDLAAAGITITHRGLTTALQSPTLIGKAVVSNGVPPRRGGARVLTDTELVDGGWEPILTMETWRRVCETLTTPGRRTGNTNQLRHPLVPIARCNCGASMRHHVDKWKVKSGEIRSMGRLLCTNQQCLIGIGYDAVDEAVGAAVLDLLDREAWDALRTLSRADRKAAVAEVADRLARMWDLVLGGSVEVEEYAEAKALWSTIDDQVADDAEAVDLPDVADVREAWPDLGARERLLVYRAAIKTLTIKPATRRGGRGVDLNRIDIDWAI